MYVRDQDFESTTRGAFIVDSSGIVEVGKGDSCCCCCCLDDEDDDDDDESESGSSSAVSWTNAMSSSSLMVLLLFSISIGVTQKLCTRFTVLQNHRLRNEFD